MSFDFRKSVLPVRIILLRPEQGRNVGTVVRAAANFGAESVRVVGAVAWTDEEERQARVASAGAWDLIGGIRHHSDLSDAAEGCTVLAGTSARPRRSAGMAVSPAEFFAGQAGRRGMAGLVFGPESQGLSAEELARCHVWIRIPTTEEFPSLNLAQAALLLLYEAFRNLSGAAAPLLSSSAESSAAPLEAQEAFLARWLPEKKEAAQFRRLLHRAQPTPGDLALLENLLNRLKKGN